MRDAETKKTSCGWTKKRTATPLSHRMKYKKHTNRNQDLQTSKKTLFHPVVQRTSKTDFDGRWKTKSRRNLFLSPRKRLMKLLAASEKETFFTFISEHNVLCAPFRCATRGK